MLFKTMFSYVNNQEPLRENSERVELGAMLN